MKPKELDCVVLKDGIEGCLVEDFQDGHFLLEDTEHEKLITISIDDIDKITYVA